MSGGMPGEEDRALIRAWVEGGDEASFGGLVARHEGLMRRSAAVALGASGRRDPGLIDDSVQEARLRLLSALRSYRGDSAPATFLAAVARRAALDELRKEGRQRGRLLRLLSLEPEPDPGAADPARGAEADEGRRAVLAALDRLGEPERSLVYLRDAEGLEVSELAAAFGLAEGTVKSKLFRARRRLRARLEREGRLP
jgi:RNA polymerase sigma-70 factor, ECF subfamily